MPRKCIIPNCRLQNDDPGCLKLNFFQVPFNEESKRKWSDSIQNHFHENVEFKKYTYVCAFHFEEKYFNYGGKLLRLTKDANPTIFDFAEIAKRPLNQHEAIDMQSVSGNLDNVVNENIRSVIDPLSDTSSNTSLLTNASDTSCTGRHRNVMGSANLSTPVHNNRSGSNELLTKMMSCPAKRIFKKSLVNINVDTVNDVTLLKKIIKNGQKEVRELRRMRRVQAMRLYGARSKVKTIGNLIDRLKKKNLIPEVLKVSSKNK